jgi:hypothetical protein
MAEGIAYSFFFVNPSKTRLPQNQRDESSRWPLGRNGLETGDALFERGETRLEG